MKLGIVIPAYNRPDYLRKCLNSLKAAVIPQGTEIVIVDDCSNDTDTIGLLNSFSIGVVIRNERNYGVCYSLKAGIEKLIASGCDLIMNLDSDAIVRPDFIEKILVLKERFPHRIITGFNCLTKNRNGTERHPIIEWGEGWNRKKSVGGLNMCFDLKQYQDWILPALEKGMKRLVNWDAEACVNSGGAVCTVPSVVQHIGIKSSMGHSSNGEPPDVADDFLIEEVKVVEYHHFKHDTLAQSGTNAIQLPSVTLVTINCDKLETGIKAMDESMKGISFGAVKFLTSAETDYPFAVNIPHIGSIQEYSRFMVKELYKYIDTDYMLIIQSDGYVKNPQAWTDDFLKYDYIGATWWYNDQHNVGNGGFSLRSKKLMQAVATDRKIMKTHPEDHIICRLYGRYLSRRFGFKFAPDHVAKKFSIEGYKQNDKTYTGQFGFHGGAVIFPVEEKQAIPVSAKNAQAAQADKPQIVVINQPFGLGDFIFCIPIARDYIAEGYKVIWPVIPAYQNINKHFPEITFINKEMLKIDYERKDEYELNGMRVIPLRWSYEILNLPFRDCMKSKYLMFKKDWRRWRESSWVRDTAKEDELFYEVLGLKDGEKFNLINATFRNDLSGWVPVQVRNDYRNVELKTLQGFTLLDWCKVIENASTIHTVSTSINYLIELLDLKASEIHLYVRKPDERDFRNVDYLFSKRYRLHY